MHLARVCGNVVASIKASGLSSHKLLLVEPVAAIAPLASNAAADNTPTGIYVAVDLIGAGIGEIVLVTRGSAARIDGDSGAVPTDAAVIAIVDSVQLHGKPTFIKR
jgi:microcompartment protein CcmK/EutM